MNRNIRGRKLKFPSPNDYRPSEPAIICPAERVMGLYNQESGDKGKKIAKKVRMWFAAESIKRGWAGVHFLKEVQSNYGAGCVLWRPPDVSIAITQHTLVLPRETE